MLADQLDQSGFALVSGILTRADIAILIELFARTDISRSERDGETYGVRNLLMLPEVRRVAGLDALAIHLRPLLGPRFQAVRGLFFDKTLGANWPVLWHQDLSLAVKAQVEVTGWSNWSIKRGVTHVQPPAAILARMVTVRLHLDDCPATNGPLRVIPRSHRDGVLPRPAIQDAVANRPVETVMAATGDALFMKPLILHASSPAMSPGHRRVLHLEFAPAGLLPTELSWAETA